MPLNNQSRVESEGSGTVKVLAVSPIEDDHNLLNRILPPPRWNVYRAASIPEAISRVKRHWPLPLILCEQNLVNATWKELLDSVMLMPQPPLLIVTSRLADEQLWAEALSLGAYDVLAKPFDEGEIQRCLTSGWSHWHRDHLTVPPGLRHAASGM